MLAEESEETFMVKSLGQQTGIVSVPKLRVGRNTRKLEKSEIL